MPQPYQNWTGQGRAAYGAGRAGVRADSREKFIVRTYNHLFGAIVLFALIEIGLFMSGLAEPIAMAMLGGSWLLVLGGFMLVSWLASRAAQRTRSMTTQYVALGGFVLAWAIMFVPLPYIADIYAPGAIQSAAMVTIAGFAALTGIAFWTRKDFSFLGGLLRWAFVVALVGIVAALLFGFQLGTWFSVAMVGLAGAALL